MSIQVVGTQRVNTNKDEIVKTALMMKFINPFKIRLSWQLLQKVITNFLPANHVYRLSRAMWVGQLLHVVYEQTSTSTIPTHWTHLGNGAMQI